MENLPKVSVTVPVYNTSPYLKKCLDSLAAQTLKDIEVIIVDDGSTDGSGTICDEYAARHPNFKVIHQSNGGLAVARQTGLDAAKGEYVIPCDSDDWVDPDMYEALYKKGVADKADIVVCGFTEEYPGGRSIHRRVWFESLDPVHHKSDILKTNLHNTWCRLIKRELFQENRICYEPGVNMGEDKFILYKLLHYNPKISQIDFYPYHYRKTAGSYTSRLKYTEVKKAIAIVDWVESNYSVPDYSEGIFLLKVNHVFSLVRSDGADMDYIMRLLETRISWRDFFKHRMSVKSIAVYCAKLIPVAFVSALVRKAYSMTGKDFQKPVRQ